MDPVANEDGFKYYEVTTVDPGVSIILATLLFCALLLAALPCLVKLGERCSERRKASDTDSSGGGSNHAEGNDEASVANSEIHSVASAAGEIATDAVNAILDSGGPAARRKRTAVARRDQAREDHSVGSAMGKLEHDDVSFRDAVDAHDPVYRSRTTTEKGRGATNRAKMTRLENGFDRLLEIAEWDYETKRIVKLALPFVVQALVMGTSEAARVAVIGRLIGTSEAAAYVVVDAYVGLTYSFLGGYHEALITVCSQAIGARNRRLAGQYVQISIILYFVSALPFVAFWMYYTDNLLIWLGFDEYTAQIAEEFAKVYVFASMLKGISESIHELLDVIGRENFSTLAVTLNEMISVLLVVAIALNPDATLEKIGFSYLFLHCIFFFGTVAVIMYKGWFDRYLGGMIGRLCLNLKAVGVLLRTSASLSFGYLLTYGEWEILTIFASFLGPAEVAAWALLGALWDAVELVTEAIADAAEVRVAFLLGAAQPSNARMSAYKTFYLGSYLAIVISSILFIMGEDLATWMTRDPTLQRMLNDLIPLFGIGNVGLTIGTISWTIVGAQGRYRLSTGVGFLGSWFVTMPLAALSTIVLNFDLQGQTAAVVVGYMVSGTVNSYFLLRSDWEKLSEKVIEDNGRWESDSDDSSSSSSESDSGGEFDEDSTGIEITLDSVERGVTSASTAAATGLDTTLVTDTSSVASKKSVANSVSEKSEKAVDEASVATAGSAGPKMATAPPAPADESFETAPSIASQKSPTTKSKKKKSDKKKTKKTSQKLNPAGSFDQSLDGHPTTEDQSTNDATMNNPSVDQTLLSAPLTPILKRKDTSQQKPHAKSLKQKKSSRKMDPSADETPSSVPLTPTSNHDPSTQKSPKKSKSKKKGSAEKKAKQPKDDSASSDPAESVLPAQSLATGVINPTHVALDTNCNVEEMLDIVSDLILPDFPEEARPKALPQPHSTPE